MDTSDSQWGMKSVMNQNNGPDSGPYYPTTSGTNAWNVYFLSSLLAVLCMRMIRVPSTVEPFRSRLFHHSLDWPGIPTAGSVKWTGTQIGKRYYQEPKGSPHEASDLTKDTCSRKLQVIGSLVGSSMTSESTVT